MSTFDSLTAAIDEVAAERAGLEDEYEAARADIESQYQLTETPEEQQTLARLLERLNNERDEAVERLGRGYDQARSQILERGAAAEGRGVEELDQMAGRFEQTYARIAGAREAAARNSNLAGMPGMGPQDSGVEGAAARANAGLAGAAQMRNATTEEGISWLADKMLMQRQAGIGDAMRTATRVGGEQEGAHNRQVNQRVNQERLVRAGALQDLSGRFDQRNDSLLGMSSGLAGELAQMREQQRQFNAQLAEQQAARAAASAARSGGRSSGGSSGGSGGSGGPSASGLKLDDEAYDRAKFAGRNADLQHSVRGVNLAPGSGGLPLSVGVRGGQPYTTGSSYSGGYQWDPRNNTPRGR